MGLFDWFGKKKPQHTELGVDPLHDLTLSKLRVGYLLDFDMKTWQVTDHYRYDFGEGYGAEEWELQSAGETRYLEREEDDEVEWSLARKIPIGAIDGDVRKHIMEHEDPPSRVVLDGVLYHLEGSGAGYMTRRGSSERAGFVYWDFVDRDEKRFVSIEQWGETEFEASTGEYVEEYQFTNILPGGPEAVV